MTKAKLGAVNADKSGVADITTHVERARMRLIIAGSRSLTDYRLLTCCLQQTQFLAELQPSMCIILSGCARGIDRMAIRWAREQGLNVERHPAKWMEHGQAAGFKRNEQMVRIADGLLAIWDGVSSGTAHCMGRAHAKGIPMEVFQVMLGDNLGMAITRFNF